jgi:hypothetical protein
LTESYKVTSKESGKVKALLDKKKWINLMF